MRWGPPGTEGVNRPEEDKRDAQVRLKICHLTTVHGHNDTRLTQQCEAAVKSGYEVHVIAHNVPDQVVNGITYHGVEPFQASHKRWVHDTSFIFTAKGLELDANIYHLHNVELFPAVEWISRHDKAVILDLHEDYLQDALPRIELTGLGQILRKFWFRSAERRALKWIDLIISNNCRIVTAYQKRGYSALAVNDFPRVADLRQRKFDPSNCSGVFCYVGTLSTKLGILELITAAAAARIKLLLVGSFDSVHSRKTAMALPGWSRVEHIQDFDFDIVDQVLGRSCAGILLEHPAGVDAAVEPEQLGRYLAAGIPIIVADKEGWKQVVEANGCGRVVGRGNPASIAEAFRWFKDNPDGVREMADAAKQLALENYTWELESRKLLESYRQIFRARQLEERLQTAKVR